MKRTSFVLALAILGLSTAPLFPTYPQSIHRVIPHQVMAAPVMQQGTQTASVASVYVELAPDPTPVPTIAAKAPVGDILTLIRSKSTARFGMGHVDAMMTLVGKESGANPYAINPYSGACGIPQALPCSKLLNVIGSLDNVEGQIDWMLDYIARRYGTPSQALAFHRSNNWY